MTLSPNPSVPPPIGSASGHARARLSVLASAMVVLIGLGGAPLAWAQPDTTPVSAAAPASAAGAAYDQGAIDAERARVDAERSQAEQLYAQQQYVCWKRFAVNRCLREARQERRRVLDALRQQDLALNERERRHAAAEQLQRIESNERAQQQRQQRVPVLPASAALPD